MGSVQNHQRDDLLKGEQLFQDGDSEKAIEIFQEIVDQNPENIEALNNLGVVCYEKKQFRKSVDYWLQGLEYKSDNQDLLDNISGSLKDEKAFYSLRTKLSKYLSEKSLSLQKRNILKQFGGVVELSTHYNAAIQTFDITPNLSDNQKVQLQGYASPPRLAASALTPLTLQILLLEDTNYNKSVIVSADLFGFDSGMVKEIRNALKLWGIPPESIVLNASHTHYAPGTVDHLPSVLGPFYSGYAKQIVQAIIGNMEGLYEELQPCMIYTGMADAQIGVNRRLMKNGQVIFGPNPEGYYEKHTPFILIDLLKSSKRLVLVNHGCHPTGYGAGSEISADYPAYLREYLKNSEDIDEAMFLQGAAGTSKSATGNNGELRFTNSPEEVIRTSISLANPIQNALGNILQVVSGGIFAKTGHAQLPFNSIPDRSDLTSIIESDTDDMLKKSWAEYLLNNNPENLTESLSLELQLMAFGNALIFVTLPGEPTAELGKEILSQFTEGENVLLLGYTNGLQAYLPVSKELQEGGYEADAAKYVYNLPSNFTNDADQGIIKNIGHMKEQWANENDSDAYGRYIRKEDTGQAFFTLSSGRCGTKTLAYILNTAENARVYHHPLPFLVNETLQAYNENIDKSQTFWRARRSVIRDAWKDNLIFGELDHNMTPFAPAIAEEIPNSKFIVLVRNPWDFVRSGMRRGYYKGHPWDSGRLCPDSTHPDFERWENMSQFEKVCWLWNETYSRIFEYLELLPETRYEILRFEDLIESTNASQNLFEILRLDGFNDKRIKQILSKKLNKQTGGDYPVPKDWDTDLHVKLQQECRSGIEKFEYTGFYTKEDDDNQNNPTGKSKVNKIETLLDKIGYKAHGYSDDGYPFVELINGLKFYGIPRNGDDTFIKHRDPQLKKYFPPDLLEIILNIRDRYINTFQQNKYYKVKQGDTFVELGAYLGYYAMATCEKVGVQGRAIAVEFIPENYDVLEKNLTENFPHIGVAVNKGVWSSQGKKTAYVGGCQVNSFRQDVVAKYHSSIKEIEVEADTIDNIIAEQNIDHVDLMVIQINGNELEALEGMQKSILFTQNFTIASRYGKKDVNEYLNKITRYFEKHDFIILKEGYMVYASKNLINNEMVNNKLCSFSDIIIPSTCDSFYEEFITSGKNDKNNNLISDIINKRWGEVRTKILNQTKGKSINYLDSILNDIIENNSTESLLKFGKILDRINYKIEAYVVFLSLLRTENQRIFDVTFGSDNFQYLEKAVNCDNCQHDNLVYKVTPLIKKYTGNLINPIRIWRKCNNCGLAYVSPRPSSEILQKYYENKTDAFDRINGELKRINQLIHIARERIEYLQNLNVSKGKILDIGGGIGVFSAVAEDMGFKSTNLDFNTILCEYSSNRFHIEVKSEDFMKINSEKNEYDIITAWETIEHVTSPRKLMEKVASHLKIGGIWSFATPVFDCAFGKTQGNESLWWVEPGHLYYFSFKSINYMLSNAGFELLEIRPSIEGSGRMEFYTKLVK